MSSLPSRDDIIERIMTVYDPEFPLIDIWTMGLIYEIVISDWSIVITMTLTTPNCPAADYIPMATKNAIIDRYPEYEVSTHMTFEPMRTVDMMLDEDLKKLFS